MAESSLSLSPHGSPGHSFFFYFSSFSLGIRRVMNVCDFFPLDLLLEKAEAENTSSCGDAASGFFLSRKSLAY
jgi:hypothetical protein